MGEITELLQKWKSGDLSAIGKVTTIVYQDLHRMAAHYLKGEWSSHTMEACTLVHEVYLRMPSIQEVDFAARGQFISVVAGMMRNILVDHARRRKALKRHWLFRRSPSDVLRPESEVDVLAIHFALEKLTLEFPRSSEVVELRFFGGLTAPEVAEVLGISLSTVEREWRFAKAWLRNDISGQT